MPTPMLEIRDLTLTAGPQKILDRLGLRIQQQTEFCGTFEPRRNLKQNEEAVAFVTEAFATPVCRMAVIEDQDGNHITVHKRHA